MELIYLSTILAQLTVGGVFATMWWVDRDSHHNAWWSISQALLALSLCAGHFVAVRAVGTPGHLLASAIAGALVFGSGVTGLAGAWTWLGRKLRLRDALLMWAAAMAVLMVAVPMGRHAGNVTGALGFSAMLIAAGAALARTAGASRFVGALFVARGLYVASVPWVFEKAFGVETVATGLPLYLLAALGLLVLSFRRKAEALRSRNGALELLNVLAALGRESRCASELSLRAAQAIGDATGARVSLVLQAQPGPGTWRVAGACNRAGPVFRAMTDSGSRPLEWAAPPVGFSHIDPARPVRQTGLPDVLRDALLGAGAGWAHARASWPWRR